jgi:hypothetical protein
MPNQGAPCSNSLDFRRIAAVRRASHEFLPGLFTAPGAETLQTGLHRVWVLSFLLGLLLNAPPGRLNENSNFAENFL